MRQTQLELECAADRAVAGREGVVDGQGGDPDGGGSTGASQQMGFVLLCALEGAAPLVERSERPQAACGGTVHSGIVVLPPLSMRSPDVKLHLTSTFDAVNLPELRTMHPIWSPVLEPSVRSSTLPAVS